MNSHPHPTLPPLFSLAELADSHPLQTPERQREAFRTPPPLAKLIPASESIRPHLGPQAPGTDIHPLSWPGTGRRAQ